MPAPLAGFAVSAALGLAGGLAERLAGAAEPPRESRDPKALKAAGEFEAMFLEQMLERVFASGGQGGPMAEAGPGAGIYQSMMVKEYAGMIARSGGVGLSDQIYGEILKLQEGGSHVGRR